MRPRTLRVCAGPKLAVTLRVQAETDSRLEVHVDVDELPPARQAVFAWRFAMEYVLSLAQMHRCDHPLAAAQTVVVVIEHAERLPATQVDSLAAEARRELETATLSLLLTGRTRGGAGTAVQAEVYPRVYLRMPSEIPAAEPVRRVADLVQRWLRDPGTDIAQCFEGAYELAHALLLYHCRIEEFFALMLMFEDRRRRRLAPLRVCARNLQCAGRPALALVELLLAWLRAARG